MNRINDGGNLNSLYQETAFSYMSPSTRLHQEWYAVYTIVRHEKTVKRSIEKRGIETFLPLREVVSQWTDRKKLVQLPLFPGYLFVRLYPGDSQSIFQVLNTRGVVRILSANGRLQPVPERQIDSVKNLTGSNVHYDPHPHLVSGSEVVVMNGPLRGISGRVLDKKGDNRLIISIDIIKRSVAVKVDAADVELV